MGLTSVASLSLGLSMSMSGGPALNNIARANPILANRRESLDLLHGRKHHRTSFSPPTRRPENQQNNIRGVGDHSPCPSASRFKKVSIEDIPEEVPEKECLLTSSTNADDVNACENTAAQANTEEPAGTRTKQNDLGLLLLPTVEPVENAGSHEQLPLLQVSYDKLSGSEPPILSGSEPILNTVPEEVEPPLTADSDISQSQPTFQILTSISIPIEGLPQTEASGENTPHATAAAGDKEPCVQPSTAVTFHYENEVETESEKPETQENTSLQANGPVLSELQSNKSDGSQHSPPLNYAINPDLKIFIQVGTLMLKRGLNKI